MRRISLPCHTAAGASSAEFALVLPLFLSLIMLILAVAIGAFSLSVSATGVASGARQAGLTSNAGAGYAITRRILSVVSPAASVAGATSIATGSAGCERGLTAHLSAPTGVTVPLLGRLGFTLRAGSQTRVWQFYPGQPADECE